MALEILRALFKAGIPVALASYALVWWTLRHGYLGTVNSLKEVEQGFSRLSKEKKSEAREYKKALKAAKRVAGPGVEKPSGTRRLNPVHDKWLKFGGGFYGVVGLLTYGVVELAELRDFFLGFGNLRAFFAHLGLDMLIGIIVGAVKNFLAAIAWPMYWLSDIQSDYIWAWFIVAYAAYWAGAKLALYRFANTSEGQRGPWW
jgi:hypothetical protein